MPDSWKICALKWQSFVIHLPMGKSYSSPIRKQRKRNYYFTSKSLDIHQKHEENLRKYDILRENIVMTSHQFGILLWNVFFHPKSVRCLRHKLICIAHTRTALSQSQHKLALWLFKFLKQRWRLLLHTFPKYWQNFYDLH